MGLLCTCVLDVCDFRQKILFHFLLRYQNYIYIYNIPLVYLYFFFLINNCLSLPNVITHFLSKIFQLPNTNHDCFTNKIYIYIKINIPYISYIYLQGKLYIDQNHVPKKNNTINIIGLMLHFKKKNGLVTWMPPIHGDICLLKLFTNCGNFWELFDSISRQGREQETKLKFKKYHFFFFFENWEVVSLVCYNL